MDNSKKKFVELSSVHPFEEYGMIFILEEIIFKSSLVCVLSVRLACSSFDESTYIDQFKLHRKCEEEEKNSSTDAAKMRD